MQKRDEEINKILSAIDDKPEADGKEAASLPEGGLLSALPISGNRTTKPEPAHVTEEPVQTVEDEEEESAEERAKSRRAHRVWRAVQRIYYALESVILVAAALGICAYLSWFLLTGVADFL